MRYEIDGKEIRSENAALPTDGQRASAITNWIDERDNVQKALDYGCGKLRYSIPLREAADELTVVDSKVQINRTQKIGGERTTIDSYVERWDGVTALTVEQLEEKDRSYDTALCCNVLSTIPDQETINQCISLIGDSLSPEGACLFATMYRNSYYKRRAESEDSEPYLHGYLIEGQHRYSYFGLIDQESLTDLISENGLEVEQAWVSNGTAYVEAIPDN
jgi:2-polyprenyl-3-methyl-5-hydroxy-6-metoxy-1,4-benzoquinol methylase